VIFGFAVESNASPQGFWDFDDCELVKASQIIVHGSPGAQRIEITGEHVAGYDSGNVLQTEMRADDGSIQAGAGAVILDAEGIHRDVASVVESGYLIRQEIADGDTVVGQLNLDRGSIYGITAYFYNGSDTDDNFQSECWIRNSDDNTCAIASLKGGASSSRSHFIAGYTGPQSGGTVPYVRVSIKNTTGATKIFGSYVLYTKIL